MTDRPLITPGMLPQDRKLDKAMLPEMGDSCVQLLTHFGVANPAVILVAIDVDTGEVATVSNLADEDMKAVIKELAGFDEETVQ